MFLVQRAMVYGYANARTKAMKALLLSSSKIREMTEVKSAGEVAELLQDTPYKEDLNALAAAYSGIDLVDYAVSKNLARTADKLLRISPKNGQEVLRRLLMRWGVHDLKILLIAKNEGESKEKTRKHVVEIGEFKGYFLEKLLSAKDVADLVKRLEGTDYGKPLQAALGDYLKHQSLLPLFNALDRLYFKSLAESAGLTDEKEVGRLISSEVDAKNITTVLRAKAANAEPEKAESFLIPGGRVSQESLKSALRAPGVPEAAKILGDKSGFDFSEAVRQFNEKRSVSLFEIQLEKAVVRRFIKTMRLATLSLAAILSFLYLKETEASNVRKILRGKEYALSSEKVREMVFAVE